MTAYTVRVARHKCSYTNALIHTYAGENMSDASGIEWHSQARNYDREKRQHKLQFEPTADHPLREITVVVSETSVKKSDTIKSSGHRPAFMDPLSQAFEGKDPLSVFAAEANAPSVSNAPRTSTSSSETFEPWVAKRTSILSKFTTTEKLSIVTVMALSTDRKDASSVSEKVKNRLEQLDDLEEGSLQETLNLSQQEYIHRIEVWLCHYTVGYKSCLNDACQLKYSQLYISSFAKPNHKLLRVVESRQKQTGFTMLSE